MFTPSPPTPVFSAKYVSSHKRAQIVRILLMVGIALSLFSLVFSVVQYAVPELANFDDETVSPPKLLFALFIMGLGLLEIGVYIATIVFFLMWLYRSYENLPAFGVLPGDVQYSSGWAVGSFFVPFVLLIVPYFAVRELWRKSVPNQSNIFRDLSPPAFFPIWWAAWLANNIVGQIYLRTMFQTDLSPEIDLALGVASSALSIVAAAFAIMVVGEIDRQQTASAEVMGTATQTHQPPLPPFQFDAVTPT